MEHTPGSCWVDSLSFWAAKVHAVEPLWVLQVCVQQLQVLAVVACFLPEMRVLAPWKASKGASELFASLLLGQAAVLPGPDLCRDSLLTD